MLPWGSGTVRPDPPDCHISHTNELSEQSARRIEALATEFMQAFFSAHNIQPEREERELKLDTRTRTNAKPEAGNEQ